MLLDIVIVAIVGICLISGAFRGLIKELSSIIGIVAGFYAAFRYYPLLSGKIAPWFTEATLANIIAFAGIFLVVFFLVSFLGALIRQGLSVVSMGWVDKAAGSLFGFLKGILIVAVLLLVLTSFLPKEFRMLKESRLAPHTMQLAEGIVNLVPDDLKNKFYDHLKSLKDYWEETDQKV